MVHNEFDKNINRLLRKLAPRPKDSICPDWADGMSSVGKTTPADQEMQLRMDTIGAPQTQPLKVRKVKPDVKVDRRSGSHLLLKYTAERLGRGFGLHGFLVSKSKQIVAHFKKGCKKDNRWEE
jgi:hypothetical protein